MPYKIMKTFPNGIKSFSQGTINIERSPSGKVGVVNWSVKKGKIWTSEKTLKDHILYAILYGMDVSTWQVIEITFHPPKPLEDFIDAKMTAKILSRGAK